MDAPVEASSLVLRNVDYLGAHPAAPAELSGIDVAFEHDAVTFVRRKEQLGSISWQDVKGLSAFSETLPAKVTFPAVFFFGVFAFLFKQQGSRVLLRVEDQQGDWLFEVSGIKLVELREGLATIRSRHDL